MRKKNENTYMLHNILALSQTTQRTIVSVTYKFKEKFKFFLLYKSSVLLQTKYQYFKISYYSKGFVSNVSN